MRSSCPSCHAGYDIPDTLVGARRKVRCASCGTAWTVVPPARAAAAPAPLPRPAPEPPAMDRLRMEQMDDHRGGRGALLAWAATVAVLVGAGVAAYTFRDAIVQAWPPSARAYEALGILPANGGSGASR